MLSVCLSFCRAGQWQSSDFLVKLTTLSPKSASDENSLFSAHSRQHPQALSKPVFVGNKSFWKCAFGILHRSILTVLVTGRGNTFPEDLVKQVRIHLLHGGSDPEMFESLTSWGLLCSRGVGFNK